MSTSVSIKSTQYSSNTNSLPSTRRRGRQKKKKKKNQTQALPVLRVSIHHQYHTHLIPTRLLRSFQSKPPTEVCFVPFLFSKQTNKHQRRGSTQPKYIPLIEKSRRGSRRRTGLRVLTSENTDTYDLTGFRRLLLGCLSLLLGGL